MYLSAIIHKSTRAYSQRDSDTDTNVAWYNLFNSCRPDFCSQHPFLVKIIVVGDRLFPLHPPPNNSVLAVVKINTKRPFFIQFFFVSSSTNPSRNHHLTNQPLSTRMYWQTSPPKRLFALKNFISLLFCSTHIFLLFFLGGLFAICWWVFYVGYSWIYVGPFWLRDPVECMRHTAYCQARIWILSTTEASINFNSKYVLFGFGFAACIFIRFDQKTIYKF